MKNASANNKLQGFFRDVVRQSFWQLGINDATIAMYVADVLTEFARTDNLYRIRGQGGRRVDNVVEMLASAPEPSEDQRAILTERTRRKYVGDYALFMSGIFRNYITRKGCLSYYIQEGSRSYWTVSELDVSLYRKGFILFQELSKKFEYYSGALDFARKAYFAADDGEDPFAGFLRQVEGWSKSNITPN